MDTINFTKALTDRRRSILRDFEEELPTVVLDTGVGAFREADEFLQEQDEADESEAA